MGRSHVLICWARVHREERIGTGGGRRAQRARAPLAAGGAPQEVVIAARPYAGTRRGASLPVLETLSPPRRVVLPLGRPAPERNRRERGRPAMRIISATCPRRAALGTSRVLPFRVSVALRLLGDWAVVHAAPAHGWMVAWAWPSAPRRPPGCGPTGRSPRCDGGGSVGGAPSAAGHGRIACRASSCSTCPITSRSTPPRGRYSRGATRWPSKMDAVEGRGAPDGSRPALGITVVDPRAPSPEHLPETRPTRRMECGRERDTGSRPASSRALLNPPGRLQ